MKKYLFCVISVITAILILFLSHYVFGIYIPQSGTVKTFTSTDAMSIYVNKKEFTIKGVNLGTSIPGNYSSDYAIDKNTYKEWFSQIQQMGTNTIRVYTILSPEFYNAIYEYNKNNDNPLYIIHGVWLDDYIQNSKYDAHNLNYKDKLLGDSKNVVDVVHGRKYIPANDTYASGLYTKNISKWVIGYIIGSEWNDETIAYTDHQNDTPTYKGTYLSAKDNSSEFISILAYIGDNLIKYETEKYNEQRLISFANSPMTDPFTYSKEITNYFKKCAEVDVEDLEFSDKFIGGTFASYNVYPYYPDFLQYEETTSEYIDKNGKINTYYAYLKKLTEYHTIPVIITEFGTSTGRGISQIDHNTNINQGYMTEEEQGNALVSMYSSIIEANCSGGIVYSWQDEWFKKAWNTMQNIDTNYAPFWSDAQTSDQFFGLLSFDPGKEKSIVYVDGDISEWTKNDIVSSENGNIISMKYDEKYLYFLAYIKDYNGLEKIYIPIDTTQKSGSKKTNISSNTYNRNIDFLIEIDGISNSRVYVHEYYDALMAMFSENVTGKNIYVNKPKKHSQNFNKINLILQADNTLLSIEEDAVSEVYETGYLKYGNANPSSSNYNSLSDYTIKGDYIEIRLPWQLLNFSNPSEMKIHDDYFEHYGVEEQQINKMYLGIGTESNSEIKLSSTELTGWGRNVEYHERLKKSYYILKDYWTEMN